MHYLTGTAQKNQRIALKFAKNKVWSNIVLPDDLTYCIEPYFMIKNCYKIRSSVEKPFANNFIKSGIEPMTFRFFISYQTKDIL